MATRTIPYGTRHEMLCDPDEGMEPIDQIDEFGDLDSGGAKYVRPHRMATDDIRDLFYNGGVVAPPDGSNSINDDDCVPAYATADGATVNVYDDGLANCWTAAGMSGEVYQTYQEVTVPSLEERVFVAALGGYFGEEDPDGRDRTAA